MTPGLAIGNAPGRRPPETVEAREVGNSLPARMAAPYVDDDSFGSACVRVALSAARDALDAALPGHVSHVVGWCPEEEVRWIHARRIIAAVVDEHASRDVAVREFPRRAAHDPRLPKKTVEHSVSLVVLGACPWPAIIVASNVDKPRKPLAFSHVSSITDGAR